MALAHIARTRAAARDTGPHGTIMPSLKESELEQTEREALRLLEVLCRQPSVSAEGRALEETADLVEELLAGSGFATRQLRAGAGPPAVYGEQRGRSGYTLLLYNHYDVQPVDPLELWESPPFEPTIRDGRLFARGTADNKGELAVRLAVIRSLRERAGKLPITIRWIVEGEEEVASPHFDEIVRSNADLLRADACLWEGAPARLSDDRPSLGLGFKGCLAVRLDVRLLKRDAHSAVAAVVPSAPWRLVEVLSSLREHDGTIRLRGFFDRVRAPTEAERGAIAEQSESIEHDLRKTLEVEGFIDGLTGAALRERLSFAPTANIAGIATGYSGPGMKTVLPAEASAWLDFRLVPEQHPDEVLALLQAYLETEAFDDVELTVLGSGEPAVTPIEHPFVQRVARIAEDVTGQRVSITPLIGGTLPIIASLQRHLGVPGLAAPDNPFSYESRTHAPNENVRLEDVGHAARFMHTLLEGLGDASSATEPCRREDSLDG
jgi:acetylornithine deacetylase/succinyl-diaminopimelate desuccinylase-like protein